MNVLVVAPHPDDEAIGCGGALCLHVARGDRVSVVFLTSGELGLKHLPREDAWRVREAEARAAADVLKLSDLTFLHSPDWTLEEHIAETAEKLQKVLDQENADLLYVPHPADAHPDHRAAFPIVRRALRGNAVRVFGYEVWTPLTEYDEVKNISDVMERKLEAVSRYQSQLGYYQYERAVRGLNEYRGAMAGRCRYAEVFRLLSTEGEEA